MLLTDGVNALSSSMTPIFFTVEKKSDIALEETIFKATFLEKVENALEIMSRNETEQLPCSSLLKTSES